MNKIVAIKAAMVWTTQSAVEIAQEYANSSNSEEAFCSVDHLVEQVSTVISENEGVYPDEHLLLEFAQEAQKQGFDYLLVARQ